jgi:hypothetical protein
VNILDQFTTDAAGYCQGIGEGGSGPYGGLDEDDDSGTLRYVRVEYAGKLISDLTTGAENELNGIAFQGVGRQTIVDYIHVHRGQDDGVEFFGGTVSAKHVLVTCADDDSIDWVGGWRGRVQYAVVQQCSGHGDNGIEADNRKDGNALTPRSRPVLANVTLVGINDGDTTKSNFGALLREGTAATIANSVMLGFNKDCIDVDHTATFEQAGAVDDAGVFLPAGGLELTGLSVACTSPFEVEGGDPFEVRELFESGVGNEELAAGTQLLTSPFVQEDPSGDLQRFTPTGGSALLSGVQTFVDPYEAELGAFFDVVDYRGGVDPDDDWTRGWTTFPTN